MRSDTKGGVGGGLQMPEYYLFSLSNGIVTPAPFWLMVALRIYVTSVVFQSYRDLEAGDNQSLRIEPRTSGSASQKLNHSATAAPLHLS